MYSYFTDAHSRSLLVDKLTAWVSDQEGIVDHGEIAQLREYIGSLDDVALMESAQKIENALKVNYDELLVLKRRMEILEHVVVETHERQNVSYPLNSF